jgi:CDP-paratose 2-epimerase
MGITPEGINESFSTSTARSFYGSTKLASELFVQEYISAYGLNGVINRCGIIAGPWQMGKVDQGVVALWISHHMWGKGLSYIGFDGTGKQVRDILHIDDLFDLLQKQMLEPNTLNGEVYNVGGGLVNSASLSELTQICQSVSGRSIPIGAVKTTRPGDIPYYVTDNAKVTAKYAWSPKRSIQTVVEDISLWLRAEEPTIRSILMNGGDTK